MSVLYLAWRSQHHGATSIEIKRKRKYYPALKELGLLLADWTRGILFGAWAGFFFTKTADTWKGKVQKSIRSRQINRLAERHKQAINEIWGPIAKNGFSGLNPNFWAQNKQFLMLTMF